MTTQSDIIFIYPTDTVWGIGCSIYSEKGYLRIAEIKKTSIDKPLSIMFSDSAELFTKFAFPTEITAEWLSTFFLFETTLCIPVKFAKIKIPKWAIGNSKYISIRCLNNEMIKNIYQLSSGPFFSTSLNLTGERPITSEVDALQFQAKYAHGTSFISSNQNIELSGISSTIVFIHENLEFEIKREGIHTQAIKKHLAFLFSS